MERPERERRVPRKAEALQEGNERQHTASPRKTAKKDANKKRNPPDILTPRRGRAVKFTYPHESREFAHTQTGAFTIIGPACFSDPGAAFSSNMKKLDDLLDRTDKHNRRAHQLNSHKLAADSTGRWDLQAHLPKGEQILLPARRKACKLLRDYDEDRVAAAIIRNKHRLRILKASLTAAIASRDTTVVRKSSQKQAKGSKKQANGQKRSSTPALMRARTDSKSFEVKASCETVTTAQIVARTDSKSPTSKPRPAARHIRELQIDMVNAPNLRNSGAPRRMRSGHVSADKWAVSRAVSVARRAMQLNDQIFEPAAPSTQAVDDINRPKRLSRPTEKVRLAQSPSPPVTHGHRASVKQHGDTIPVNKKERSSMVVLTCKSEQGQAKFSQLVGSLSSSPTKFGPAHVTVTKLVSDQIVTRIASTLGVQGSPSTTSEMNDASSRGKKRKAEDDSVTSFGVEPTKRLKLILRAHETAAAPTKRLRLVMSGDVVGQK
ncbi:hypothetical protein B0A48_08475 [Cryoendolithus antarcticus]|uniref:Uncharacterized protein n=1 Tax=Cryoendolithus antarcticus TaxID=1507870 RepID=A0A1V8T623_9PEZI|nr:hypothetical protein B0A48_08475 [Cryoendolithus antarcticus]